MIRALSLAAALAILPLSAASAQTADPEAAIDAAAEVFEARMEEFGERAEAIAEDESLTEDQREAAIMALWAEYQPDVTAFTGVVSQNADLIAQEALADIDVDALVADALANVDVDVLAMANGFATNGAWASDDPEHMATMGLMADYAVDRGDDAEAVASVARIDATYVAGAEAAAAAAEVEAALAEIDGDLAELEVELAEMAQDDAD